MTNAVIAYETWTDELKKIFGPSATYCLEPHDQAEINKRLEAENTPSGNPDQDKKNANAANFWVMDLGKNVLACKRNYAFYAVLMVDAGGYLAPAVVEEPDPENPSQNKRPTVGDVAALLAVNDAGDVLVKTVRVKRKVATNTDDPILELDRSSTSKGAKLTGTEVGVPSLANSARIRGHVRTLAAEAPFSADEQGWMSVSEFALTSPDMFGKGAILTALVQLGLVTFGRGA